MRGAVERGESTQRGKTPSKAIRMRRKQRGKSEKGKAT